MAKYYESIKNHPIIFQCKKNNILKNDLCVALDVSLPTLQKYLKRPGLIPLDEINIMAGLFGMYPEELVCILNRNKPQLNKELVWYMEGIKQRVKNSEVK